MKYYILLIFSALLLLQACDSSSSNFIEPGAHTPISPWTYQSMLKTGMDVDWVKTDKGRIAAQKSHDDGINVPGLFRQRGLSHVRIRIAENILDNSTDVTGKTLMQELTNIVDDCLDAGLIPVIAYQAKPFKLNPTDDETLYAVVDWWRAVAEHFKNYSYKVSYDLIIETTNEVKKHNDRLNQLYAEASAAIRNIDPNRILIVAPNKISNPYELENLVVPEPHDYMMVEWHFYAAGPSRTNPKKLWTTGTEAEKELIRDRIRTAKNWSENNNIPTWVGAWRANRYPKDGGEPLYDGAPGGGEYNLDEQYQIASFISEELQKAGIPYAVNSDTKFFNRETNEWYESMSDILDAMIQ